MRPRHRLALCAGLVGAALFTGTWLITGALRPGHGPLREPISAIGVL